jgi:hypothetical protein
LAEKEFITEAKAKEISEKTKIKEFKVR